MHRTCHALAADRAYRLLNRLAAHGVQLFSPEGTALPLVAGCVGWLDCRLLPKLRTRRYVAGGQFYATGASIQGLPDRAS
jgi:flavin reductase (DIM6/NTAB) family NADH-FMN oxidoreductase RutF